MKKFLVVMVVLAMAFIGSIAFAADVTVGGMIGIRSRDFSNLSFDKDTHSNTIDTQEKVRLNVSAKAGDDVKGKLSIENYWDTWGRLENYQADGNTTAPGANPNGGNGIGGQDSGQDGFLKIREAWVSFNVPGIPVNVTGGHQLLSLGNDWFLRSKYFGSDAWVVANVTGNNTFALADIKVKEGNPAFADDIDAYAIVDVFKLNDSMTVGGSLANVHIGTGNDLYNIELTFNGKLGPVDLKAQADVQTGKDKSAQNEPKYSGNQIVVMGNIPVDPVAIDFTLARGSGNKIGDSNVKGMVTFMDIDTHYTYLYEYKIATATGLKNTGFANTTAAEVGVSGNATKNLNLGLKVWFLQATEKIRTQAAILNNTTETSSDLGTEIDGTVNWKLYDNLNLLWTLGYLAPGKALKNASGKSDAATGSQAYLILNF
jgi:hypothetical protein